MRGTVYKRTHKRKDGRTSVLYYAVIETTPPGSRRRSQDWSKGYLTKREAQQALAERITAFQNQRLVAKNTLTLGEYLCDHWLPIAQDRLKPTTFSGYQRTLNLYVVPRIGGVRLQALTTAGLTSLYGELRQRGGTHQSQRRRGEIKPLSAKTVRNVHAMLSKALNDAVDMGLLTHNPAARAKPPRHRSVSEKVDAWTAAELREFLDFVRDDRLYTCWHLAAHTGMRRGELLGLRWANVDFDAGTLAVRQTIVLEYTKPIIETPKNHEARVINLDLGTVEALRLHRGAQLAEQASWGEGYVDSGLVFRREDGSLIHPDRLSQMYDRLVRLSGLRRIRLHDLRHTHATLMLRAGVPLKVVSERLGHADPAFTLRVYQHVQSGMQEAAASTFAALLT